MKKVVLAMMMLAITGTVFAQGAKVTSAGNYYKSGDLRKAKTAIDGASVHVKTSTWAKTWMYMGKIYYAIAMDTTGEYSDIQPGAIHTSADAFEKVKANPDSKIIQRELNTYLHDYVYLKIYNDAIFAYQAKDYVAAAKNFSRCGEIRGLFDELDTLAYFNAAGMYAAQEDHETAIKYYNKILTTGYEDGVIYSKISRQYLLNADTVGARKVVSEGRVAYPDNQQLLISEFNMYVEMGETEKAISNIDKAIDANPEKAAYYYVRGKLKETGADLVGAEVDYKKTIEIEPRHLDANHDLGAMYINESVKIVEEMDALPYDDTKGYDAKKVALEAVYTKALPYLKTAYDIDPSDAEVQGILKKLYLRSKDMDSYNKLQGEIEAAGSAE